MGRQDHRANLNNMNRLSFYRLLVRIGFALLILLINFACTNPEGSEGIEVLDPTEENEESSDSPEGLYFPPSQSPEWETLSPAILGWDSSGEQALEEYLLSKETKAFIVLKDGKIVVEWYFGSHTQNTSWYWASAGKTLTSYTLGIAQEEGLLSLDDTSSDYLGVGWTSATAEQESAITVRHHLTMTSGLDDTAFDCVSPECLTFLAEAGSRWAYHNGPYTLLQQVISSASSSSFEDYFNSRIRNRIGMDGFWFSTSGTNNVFFSSARSMARFGLLNLANGQWNGQSILGDTAYLNDLKSPSQELNSSYGYLYWLNGQDDFRLPGLQALFNGQLIPNAPADTFAGLGTNDQKLFIVPSQNLVIVRMGEDAGTSQLGPSSFDTELWDLLNAWIVYD